jgi:hypothetical protein
VIRLDPVASQCMFIDPESKAVREDRGIPSNMPIGYISYLHWTKTRCVDNHSTGPIRGTRS